MAGANAAEISLLGSVAGPLDPHKMEKMFQVLCNTLGIKYSHLVRAVGKTSFEHWERFAAIELNNNALHGANKDKLVDVTTTATLALCTTYGPSGDKKCFGQSTAALGTNVKKGVPCIGIACADTDFLITGPCCTA